MASIPGKAQPDDGVNATFPTLSPAEIDIIRKDATEIEFKDGEHLWSAGDTDFCFFVILKGEVEIRDACGDGPPIATHEPGGFTGDVDVLSGRPAPIGGIARGPTLVLQMSADALRNLVRSEQDLGGKILLAFIRRREILLGSMAHGALLIGSIFDPSTTEIREFLGRNRIVHRWQKPEDKATKEILDGFGLTAADTPVVFLGQKRLTHPTIGELADILGIRRATNNGLHDLVVIGAGPAGLAAAVYGASEGLHTLLLDKEGVGGQASWSSRIENYMGFPEGLSGSDLAGRGLVQAQKFGAELSIPAEVSQLICDELGHTIKLKSGETMGARAVLVATGARYMRLPIPDFADFETRGIYYAATMLEAAFCTDSEVVVVGAGNSAGQAAVFLSQHARLVRLVVRGDDLGKSMSAYLSHRVEQIPNIEVHLSTEVCQLEGDDRLEKVYLKGPVPLEVPCSALFVFIGATPNTDFLRNTALLDSRGFVMTGTSLGDAWKGGRPPYYLETSCPGVFAAGDCRSGSVKRLASGVGEGSMAVTFIHQVLAT